MTPPTQLLDRPEAISAAPDEEYVREQRRSAVKASFIGTFIEWFDYAAYIYMSAVISRVFFPEMTGRRALILTFGLFALSFLVRPIGAIVWGHVGDKYGRIHTLTISIVMMSLATVGIGLLPGYATLGMGAVIGLLLLRMVQGFSAAGEYAGAATHLAEIAPAKRRGLYGAVVPAATASGLLLGSLMAAGLTGLLSEEALHSWGWRLPFLLAFPLGFYGLIIRRHADESAHFDNTDAPEKTPVLEVFKYPKALAIAFAGAVLNAIGFYVILTYLPTYLSEELGMAPTPAFIASSVASACYVGFALLTGLLSDRLGRRATMLTAAGFMALTIVPAFWLLDGAGLALVILVQVCLGGVLALNDGVLPSFLSEQFPTHIRLSGFALTFNVANAVFGGTAPMIATWLIDTTGSVMAPAFYLVAAALVTGSAVLFASKKNKLKTAEEAAQ